MSKEQLKIDYNAAQEVKTNFELAQDDLEGTHTSHLRSRISPTHPELSDKQPHMDLPLSATVSMLSAEWTATPQTTFVN